MAKSIPISRSGRFQRGPDEDVRRYTESVSFDWRLYRQDIAGSMAHATMLAKVGILSQRERDQILRGLKRIQSEIESGRFPWNLDLEDVHMNIEAVLTSRVKAAAKLHTARSRNDQVATDLRLWVKDEIVVLSQLIQDFQRALLELAEQTRHGKGRASSGAASLLFLPLPGYTHLQRAQPVCAAHHLLAYVEMLQRDQDRFLDCGCRANVSPLGSGAIAGTSLPIDRQMTSRLLGFSAPSTNSMDAVSDRDFIAEFLFASALTGVHLSRLAEDFILWSSSEFAFIRIGDSHTTGSSLMPQKKNPDVAELGRGKAGRLLGNLVSLLTTLKGLPMTYNRDLQEDKEPLFDSADTLESTLKVFAGMVRATQFNAGACLKAVADPNLLVTELADFLVREGVPFRKAHHLLGTAVKCADEQNKSLLQLTPAEWRLIHPIFGKKRPSTLLSLAKAFNDRNSLIGSPGQKQVELQIKAWKRRLKSKK